MPEIKITVQNWDRLKLKLKRKYNTLTDQELVFNEGEEEKLISYLSKRLKRNKEYILFTLQKGLQDIQNNRL